MSANMEQPKADPQTVSEITHILGQELEGAEATAAMMPCNPSREAAAFAPTVFSFVEFVSANTHAFNVAKDSRASIFGFKYSEV